MTVLETKNTKELMQVLNIAQRFCDETRAMLACLLSEYVIEYTEQLPESVGEFTAPKDPQLAALLRHYYATCRALDSNLVRGRRALVAVRDILTPLIALEASVNTLWRRLLTEEGPS